MMWNLEFINLRACLLYKFEKSADFEFDLSKVTFDLFR